MIFAINYYTFRLDHVLQASLEYLEGWYYVINGNRDTIKLTQYIVSLFYRAMQNL